jgi:hypothetical protein
MDLFHLKKMNQQIDDSAFDGWDEAKVYQQWPNVPKSILLRYASPRVKELYASLEAQPKNPARCEKVLQNLYKKIASNSFTGSKEQFESMGTCGDVDLLYLSAKVLSGMEQREGKRDNVEEATLNYYADFTERCLKRHVTVWNRIRIYHEVHGHWIFPTYAGLFGVGPFVFPRISSTVRQAARFFRDYGK